MPPPPPNSPSNKRARTYETPAPRRTGYVYDIGPPPPVRVRRAGYCTGLPSSPTRRPRATPVIVPDFPLLPLATMPMAATAVVVVPEDDMV